MEYFTKTSVPQKSYGDLSPVDGIGIWAMFQNDDHFLNSSS